MTDFPGSIYSPRTKENRPGIDYDADAKNVLFAEDVSKLDDEVIALENNLQDKIYRHLIIIPIAPDEAIPTGDGLYTFTIPAFLDGYNLTSAQAALTTADDAGDFVVELYSITKSHSVLSSDIQIDDGEKKSEDSADPSVVDTSYDDVSTGDEYRIDIPVEPSAARGLQIFLTFLKPIA